MAMTTEQRKAAGRKGGLARVPKGFARMDRARLVELSSIGGRKGAESRKRNAGS